MPGEMSPFDEIKEFNAQAGRVLTVSSLLLAVLGATHALDQVITNRAALDRLNLAWAQHRAAAVLRGDWFDMLPADSLDYVLLSLQATFLALGCFSVAGAAFLAVLSLTPTLPARNASRKTVRRLADAKREFCTLAMGLFAGALAGLLLSVVIEDQRAAAVDHPILVAAGLVVVPVLAAAWGWLVLVEAGRRRRVRRVACRLCGDQLRATDEPRMVGLYKQHLLDKHPDEPTTDGQIRDLVRTGMRQPSEGVVQGVPPHEDCPLGPE